MRTKKNLLLTVTALTACVILILSATSIRGSEKTLEIWHEYSSPEYQTDTSRAINAYERVMNRFMTITEKNLDKVESNVTRIALKLDSIDRKLTELLIRIERIEKALQITPPPEPAPKQQLKPAIPNENKKPTTKNAENQLLKRR